MIRFLYATFGKDAWFWGAGGYLLWEEISFTKFTSPTSAPKLDLLCGLIMQPLRKGKACSGVKNNAWIVVQFQGHQYSCFKNDYRNSVQSQGATGTEKTMQDQPEQPSL